jgi:uncharacterized protein (DUF1015 family)
VPEFVPFRGLRYDTTAIGGRLDAVVAPPYDVIDDELRDVLERAHPANAVRLILPRDAGDEDRYRAAAARLERWRAEGVLRSDASLAFYGYRMRFTDATGAPRETVGVFGALTLPEHPDAADVLPHERTLPKAKSDRLALLRATRANLDPIWVLSLSRGLTDLVTRGRPAGECTDADGTTHSLSVIDHADDIADIARAVAAQPAVLADGHHRFETAIAYRDELIASGRAPGGAAAIFALAVELTEAQLSIEAIHRAVRLTSSVSLRTLLAERFSVTEVGPPGHDGVTDLVRRMTERGGIGLVDAEGCALLVPRPAAVDAARAAYPSPACDTDAALVDAAIAPLLPDAEWTYRHDAADTAALVDKQLADAALLLRPVSVAQTRAAALGGVRMPQKTTFFHPKPRTGMVFRLLDDDPATPPSTSGRS